MSVGRAVETTTVLVSFTVEFIATEDPVLVEVPPTASLVL